MNTNTNNPTDTTIDNSIDAALEHTQTANAAEATESTEHKERGRCHGRDGRRCGGNCGGNHSGRRWLMPAMLIGALLIGGLIGRACTHERGDGHGRRGMDMQGHSQMQGEFGGREMGGQGGMGGMRGHGGPFGAGMIERIGSKVNATDEQKTKLTAIATKLNEGQADRQTAMQSMRQKSMELLSADPVDTNAIEQVRASQTAFMDEQSKRMSQAMVEVAQVLTPEQRAQLAKMMPAGR